MIEAIINRVVIAYRNGQIEWILECGRESLILMAATAMWIASRHYPLHGLRVISIGLCLVCCEQMMHAASDIGNLWPREVPLTMSWIGWGTTVMGSMRLALHSAAIGGTIKEEDQGMTTAAEWVKITVTAVTTAGVVGPLMHILAERQKRRAEVGDIQANVKVSMVGVAENVVAMLEKQLERLAEMNEELAAANTSLTQRVDQMESDIRELQQENHQLHAENERLRERLDGQKGADS